MAKIIYLNIILNTYYHNFVFGIEKVISISVKVTYTYRWQ